MQDVGEFFLGANSHGEHSHDLKIVVADRGAGEHRRRSGAQVARLVFDDVRTRIRCTNGRFAGESAIQEVFVLRHDFAEHFGRVCGDHAKLFVGHHEPDEIVSRHRWAEFLFQLRLQFGRSPFVRRRCCRGGRFERGIRLGRGLVAGRQKLSDRFANFLIVRQGRRARFLHSEPAFEHRSLDGQQCFQLRAQIIFHRLMDRVADRVANHR